MGMVEVGGMGEEMKKSPGRGAGLVESSKSWSQILLSSSLPLSPPMVVQTLLLIRSPLKALSFFNWAETTAGFTHTHHSYSLILHKLCKAGLLDTARDLLFSIPRSNNGAPLLSDRFFNLLIRSYGSAGLLRHSLSVFSSMNRAGVSPSVFTFNSLLHLLLRRGRTSMAKSLFNRMLSTYGVHPDTYTFNILIRGFSLHSMLHESLHFFHEMPLFRCLPDVVTYNTLIDAFCRSGNPHRAHRLLESMWKHPPSSSHIRPDTATYTALIRGYCRKKYTVEALSIYRQMLDRGIKPNNITMNTLLQGLSESGQLHKMKEVTTRDFSPDTCTFNTLIKSHCLEGRIHDAMALFSQMSTLNVAADSATYSTLVRCLCDEGEEEKAEELVDDMVKKKTLLHESGCMPIPQAFSPVLKRLCNIGKTQIAEKVVKAMMRRGTPDAISLEMLIMGHCREGRPESGYRLLLLMIRHGCAASMEVYECLLEALLLDEGVVMAYKTVMKMPKRGWRNRVKVIHKVLRGLVRGGYGKESGEMVRAMVERGVRQSIELSTESVKLMIGEGESGEGMRTVKVLYEGGFGVKVEEVVDVMLEKGEAERAWDLVLLGVGRRERLEERMCGRIVEEMCCRGMVGMAFKVFYELVEMDVRLHSSCSTALFSVLTSAGMRREAEFVRKRIYSNFIV